jgi:hypothetical protein
VCKKLAASFSFSIVFVLLLLSLTTGTAKENRVLAWQNPTAGTHAFLGDDGGGVNTATAMRHRRPISGLAKNGKRAGAGSGRFCHALI